MFYVALPLGAQEAAPLSAIDWLSQSVVADPNTLAPTNHIEPPVASTADVPQVTVTALDTPDTAPIGLLSNQVTGLPTTLWASSTTDTLIPLLQSARGL